MPKKAHKKGRVSEQEQLASKLDKALSLTKLGKFPKSSSCRFTDSTSSGKSRASGGGGGGGSGGGSGSNSSNRRPTLTDNDPRAKASKSGLAKDLVYGHKSSSSSKGGKSKTSSSSKLKASDATLKGRSQRKVSYSPARSEISSYSNSKFKMAPRTYAYTSNTHTNKQTQTCLPSCHGDKVPMS